MRLKFFWRLGLTYLLLLLVALAIVYFYTVRALERNAIESTFSQLDSLARLAQNRPPEVENIDALREWTAWMAQSGARVTVITADGTVVADSDEDPDSMDNHASRPEVRDAIAVGRGRATRFSDTVNRELVYLAVRIDWGPSTPIVVRLAEPMVQVNDAIAEVRGPMTSVSLVVLVAGGMLSLLFSRVFSRRVRELRASLSETGERMSSTIQSLEEERNQSRAILSAMSEGVAVVDSESRILFSNRAFRNELRLDNYSEALKGRHLVEITRHNEILSMVRDVLDSGDRMESEITTPGPDSQDLLVRAAPVGAEGAVLVLLNISDIRRLERVRRDFVANLSHELKTPLTAIQGFAETLLGGALEEPENSRRFAEIIRSHATRLGRLTEDLLKLSRIEAGKMEIELRPVVLRDVIEQCFETARVKAQARNQTLEMQLEDGMPTALADPHALVEVLQNLIDNAIQYSAEGRHIVVRSERDGSEARISVVDDGIGIPTGSHGRIFERFYRVDAARSRSVGGTGLGLAISRHLVDSMHGRLEIESQLGRGSTFSIILPVEEESAS